MHRQRTERRSPNPRHGHGSTRLNGDQEWTAGRTKFQAKPWVSAVSGALSTAIGAFIPIIPFFFMTGIPAVMVIAMVSVVGSIACLEEQYSKVVCRKSWPPVTDIA